MVLISFLVGLLTYFGLRRVKSAGLLYSILIPIAFIPIIPIFFTQFHYTSVFLRNVILAVFFALIIAALIQKGVIQRVIAILLLLAIALKGPMFGEYFPSTFDLAEREEVRMIAFDNYALIYERTKQTSPLNDIFEWRAKKFHLGHLLFTWMDVLDRMGDEDKCIRNLQLSRVQHLGKPYSILERTISYDTCNNEIVRIEKH